VSHIRVNIGGREAVFGGALPAITFGSDPGCLVQLDSPHVAPTHFALRREESIWILDALDADGPVFVNGSSVERTLVDEPLSLRLGDPVAGLLIELQPAIESSEHSATKDFASIQAQAPSEPVAPGIAIPDATEPAGVPGEDGSRKSFPLSGSVIRIGRDPASDLMVDDLLVSRRHAELRRDSDGGYEVNDLDSHNGTFVNGHRVTRAKLAALDVIMIGHHSYRLLDETLEESVDSGEVAYAAADLSVHVAGGVTLLDRVSFSLESRSLLGIVGPSGSGKSTLMNALAGFRLATEGDVLYGEQSLYEHYDALRHRIGFVPQDDVVHTELKVRRALEFAAELRFPADTEPAERSRRVQQVIDELGLAHRSELVVGQLSGGQRKRVSVALELLTEPSLLFLDEPTSGLDPNYERGVMEILRKVADAGRTVVVVTHSVQSLRLCDRLLVLAPGGQLAYFGPPQLVAAYFGHNEYAEVFRDLSDPEQSSDWGERFREHPHYREYVERHSAPRVSPPVAPVAAQHLASSRGWLRQFQTLTRRYLSVMCADRRNLGLLLMQAPLLGLLMLIALPGGELGPAPASQFRLISQASLVLLVLILGVTWLGMSNSVREITKELAIFRRERATGLSISAYVASKAVVLGLMIFVQSAVLIVLATLNQNGPRYAVLLDWPLGELIVLGTLAGFAAMALGLLISALAKTTDRATTILPIVLVFQLVLALGGVFPQIGNRPVLKQLGYISSTRWGFAGLASTSDLNNLQSVTGVLTQVPSVNLSNPAPLFRELQRGARGDPAWDHTQGAWLGDAGALLALTIAGLFATGLVLRRQDPGRRAGGR
jgi:ABC transport system ATP-binding/permease protein